MQKQKLAESPIFYSTLRQLPKIELHRHLDCSLRWSTVVKLAKQQKLELPEKYADLKEEFLILSPMKNLHSVLKKFLNTQAILSSESILEQIAYEAVEDAFNENIRLLELRYAPSFIQEGHTDLTFEKIHLALHKGISKAQADFGIEAGLIAIIQRNKEFSIAEEVANLVFDHKDTFIGIDLADNEDSAPPEKFKDLFQQANRKGISITVHSGEAPHVHSAKWVLDSVKMLHADRIGHGLQIVHDKNVMAEVAQLKIPLELCPYSNYLTQAVLKIEDHPIRKLKDAGVLVTVNSDDPGVFASTLTDDYDLLTKFHGFSIDELKRLNQTSFEYSFLKNKEKFRHEFF